jgi:hypothetical protein
MKKGPFDRDLSAYLQKTIVCLCSPARKPNKPPNWSGNKNQSPIVERKVNKHASEIRL